MSSSAKNHASSIPSSATDKRSGGLAQSWRVLWFGVAFLVFVGCTYQAFFRAQFSADPLEPSRFLSASWWLTPFELNRPARLNRIEPNVNFTCLSVWNEGRQIWVGGSKGVIIHSSDDGLTWEQLPKVMAPSVAVRKTPAAPRAKSKAYLRPRSDAVTQRLSAAPARGAEIILVDLAEAPSKLNPANQLYQPQKAVPNAANQAAPTPSPRELRTPEPTIEPNPEATISQQALLSNDLVDLQLVGPGAAFAVTSRGEILGTRDGGRSWRLLLPYDPDRGAARRVNFIDEKRGVAAGDFGISSTKDGGENWSIPSRPEVALSDVALTNGFEGTAVGPFPGVVQIVETESGAAMGKTRRIAQSQLSAFDAELHRIRKTNAGSLYACGGGVIACTRGFDGWRTIYSLSGISLNDICVPSASIKPGAAPASYASEELEGWAVGQGALIVASRDGGNTWVRQKSGVKTNLAAVDHTSDRVFVAGENGTLLTAERVANLHWRPLVIAEAASSAHHAWLPAPWYFLSILLLFGLVRLIPDEVAPPPPKGIGQLLVSDKPIGPEDPDHLGFREVAWGLSNYLRNKATKPPLTIAITGEWGMGKSSLMNLLQADLIHYKFRPVWFNAWHHQTEESLLASLLANIRTQAIPSSLTPEGVVFRTKLLWLRARRNLLAFLLLVAAVSFCASYFVADPSRLTHTPEALLKALANPGDALSSLSGRGAEIGKAIAVLISAVGAILTFLKGFRAFGVDPANLLASKSNAAKASDLRAQTSFRHRFATEFREVTESLNPLTMALFVDDLDRCRPEQVYDMLESINFLISCGDCFVIMGLARRRVERCVGLVFDKVAAEMPDQVDGRLLSDADKRQRFARQYLEKLINIEVPVPKGEPAQMWTLLLNLQAKAPRPGKMERAAQKLTELLPHLIPAALCGLVAALAIWCSFHQFSGEEISPEPTKEKSPAVVAETNFPNEPASDAVPAKRNPIPLAPQIGEAKFTPGQQGGVPLWAILVVTAAILAPGILRLSRRSGAVIEDSPEFVRALEEWFPFFARRPEMTPRVVKRFINRVRYFAMMEGSFRPALRWWERLASYLKPEPAPASVGPAPKHTSEDTLVALATINERHSEWFAGNLASFQNALGSLSAEEKAGLLRYGDMLHVDAATYEHFKKLAAGVEVH